MAFRLLLFISLLTENTGFSAEISVFVQTGDSVQLYITQKLPEFDDLSWINDKSDIIVKYLNESKKIKPHPSYKDRVDFNDTTFSLTLKNMQKTDSGLYTARTSGLSMEDIAVYRVSVIDGVEAPVLAVNWSSPDACSFSCKGGHVIISSIYNSSSCSPEEETSPDDNYTLNLNCSDDHIVCNHSNPVSWKTDRKKVNELCTVNKETTKAVSETQYPSWLIPFSCILTTILLASVIGWCLYTRKKDHSYSPDQPNEQTVYEKVDNIKNIKPQQSPLEMLEKTAKPCTLYDTVREHGPPDVKMETNEISTSHDSVNQSATLTENSKPNTPVTVYCTIQKQPKPETENTIYAVVNKQLAEDKSVHPKPE
ncbi:CD48 antigen [Pimephales promelas]|uniref:CD48 antigen n=1 Tax=Pimephales promelas TaxID=90988 RepID=UPI001955AB68|nr:CD48 antigen [Pimephales promelas]KAG1969110.1 SLAM family member 9-like [Pimephales promelas]